MGIGRVAQDFLGFVIAADRRWDHVDAEQYKNPELEAP